MHQYNHHKVHCTKPSGLPGMKMHVRVASDQSLKMLLHCLRVATSDPQATASEDNVST